MRIECNLDRSELASFDTRLEAHRENVISLNNLSLFLIERNRFQPKLHNLCIIIECMIDLLAEITDAGREPRSQDGTMYVEALKEHFRLAERVYNRAFPSTMGHLYRLQM